MCIRDRSRASLWLVQGKSLAVQGKSMGLVVTLDNRSLVTLVTGHWPLDTIPSQLERWLEKLKKNQKLIKHNKKLVCRVYFISLSK